MKKEGYRYMPFNYKDLTYIRAALESYETSLSKTTEHECGEDAFSEAQDDMLYITRLIGLTNMEINEWKKET